ncbi:MAG: hypothetical protein CO189_12065 [candidate division Zixibacteria bacterium CG_4_9_14_3_um_filter_46_8]|nr:MAG: hypothetical protein CO189_12065 [candidate division Zixibacteria bacterium CG_4_9_14_3_um_filter_46_8]
MKSIPALILVGVAIIWIAVWPSIGNASADMGPNGIHNYFNGLSYSSEGIAFSNAGANSYFPQNDKGERSKSGDKKSPVNAFLYSLAIPGLGELYAGSRHKPYIFLYIDMVLITSEMIYFQEGLNGEAAYRRYADLHWFRDPFNIWWNTLDSATQAGYSHRLPPTNDYEYYENIGKYDQFVWGWDDFVVDGPVLTPHREHYLELRKKANDKFDTARTFMVVAMVNHVVSAFDAAFTAKSYNKRGQSDFFGNVKIRMLPVIADNQVYPQLTFIKGF